MFSILQKNLASRTLAICSTAMACATIANQPTFDAGGFPIRMRRCIAGTLKEWETLSDSVTIIALPLQSKKQTVVSMSGATRESDVYSLPTNPEENSAGRAVLQVLSLMKQRGIPWMWQLHIVVNKGISLKGTGLGSSGASAAAGLKAMEDVLSQLNISLDLTVPEKINILRVADCGVPDNSIPAYFGGWTVFDSSRSDSFDRWKDISIGNLIVVCPKGFGMKTSDARRVLPPHPDQCLAIQDLRQAVGQGDVARYADEMQKAHRWFVEPRSRLYPRNGALYHEIRDAALSAGASGVTISGAGPSVLAIVTHESQTMEVGTAMHCIFHKYGFDSVALLVDIAQEGAIVLPPFSHAVP